MKKEEDTGIDEALETPVGGGGPEKEDRRGEAETDAEAPIAPTPDEAAPSETGPEDLRKKCDELLDRLQRTMAEFDNFRKRTAKEKASMYSDGVRDAIEKLLPVIDNFERAMEAAPDQQGSFYTGVEMIYRQLTAALDEIGVEVLPGAGEAFDLNIHHAVAHVDDPAYGENIVIEELQKGYKYKDRVIRHVMVKVAN